MRFFKHLLLGYDSYLIAAKFIVKHNLWWYFTMPLLLSVGVYYLGVYMNSLQFDVLNFENLKQYETINALIWLVLKALLYTTLGFLWMKFTKYFVVILLSPILATLSQKVEEIETGNKYPFSIPQTIRDIKRGAQIALRNIFWEYFLFFIVFIVAQFFGGEFKNVLLLSLPLFFGFYFYGFGFMDYINERRRLNIEQSIYFLRNHRGVAVAIGSVYSLLFMVPYVGVVIAPIWACVAATIAMHELVDLSNNEWALPKKKQRAKEVADQTRPAVE